MCCCCPGAISAIFCLWFQSGCSKGTVAGALTFFPPDPSLYEFERRRKDDKVLGKDEEADENDAQKVETVPSDTVGTLGDPGRSGPLEAETKGQTNEKMKSPAQQFTEQAAERRKRAKERSTRDARDNSAGVKFKLLLDPRLQVPPHDDGCIEAVKVPSKNGVYIAAVIYRLPADRATPQTRTIIYSHGNATDIGAMFPIQVVLARSLDCNVVVYDYSGYGESGGVPEELNTYQDIEAVYGYVKNKLADGNEKRIILYGQSVGSGPCCYIAAQGHECGGMILHSPFTSGMRVLTPSRALACLDIYPNIDRVKKAKCPVMIIHGKLDQEVDVSHGQEMHSAVPLDLRRQPWWVPDRGHNDITDGPGKLAEYVRRLRSFLASLENV